MMSHDVDPRNYETEFSNRFDWRRKRQIENLIELDGFAHAGGADSVIEFSKLWGFKENDPLYALQHSILSLWLDAAECYIFGLYQSCILTCGSVVERSLKYEYQKLKGIGLKGHWTLGKCIHELDGLIDSDIIT